MHAQLSRKIEQKDHELQHVLKQNESHVARLRELEMEQQIARKQTEIQLVQAQQQQKGMALELSRFHKERKREDEFSKAFQQEFNANKALRANNEYLHKQLDSALDSLDVSVCTCDIVHFLEPRLFPTGPATAAGCIEADIAES